MERQLLNVIAPNYKLPPCSAQLSSAAQRSPSFFQRSGALRRRSRRMPRAKPPPPQRFQQTAEIPEIERV